MPSGIPDLDLEGVNPIVRLAAVEHDCSFFAATLIRMGERLDALMRRVMRLEGSAGARAECCSGPTQHQHPAPALGYDPEVGLCSGDVAARLVQERLCREILERELQDLQAAVAALERERREP